MIRFQCSHNLKGLGTSSRGWWKWQSHRGQGSWGLALGELLNPSLRLCLSLFVCVQWAWQPLLCQGLSGPDMEVMSSLCPSMVHGYCYFPSPGAGSGGPGGVRVTHSGLSCPSVSEGQNIPPSFFFSGRESMAHRHWPSFCFLAEETATLATGSISSRFPLLAHSHSLLFSFQCTSFVSD